MAAPFFYIDSWSPGQQEITLDEDNSRHVIQVLRMRPGEALRLTDGKGTLLDAVILDDHKKKCRAAIKNSAAAPQHPNKVTIAISPVKNAARFEWFLEKATEIGVSSIIPLICERTERQSIRTDRLRNILVSAMLQSQQAWLPTLAEPTPLSALLTQTPAGQAYIAHLPDAPRATDSLVMLTREQSSPITEPQTASHPPDPPVGPVAPLRLGRVSDFRPSALGARPASCTILIGPEGDFTPKEVEAALTARFIPVSLGHTRLRTETAGIVAAILLCIQ
jgi:16S rRNA (uracil1498-N3)-methyltransferase